MNQPIAILNLTRLGDLLMTVPMIRILRNRHRGSEIHLIVADGFEEIGRLMPVDRVSVIDPLLLGRLSVTSEIGQSLLTRKDAVLQHISPILTQEYAAIYNLTHSTVSSLLTSLMRGPVVAGLTLDRKGYRRIENPWVRYFFAGNLNRGANPIHLVDLSLGIAGGVGELDREALNLIDLHEDATLAAEALVAKHGVLQTKGPLIALQVSASALDKQWEAHKYGEVGKRLVRDLGATILYTGTARERQLCEEAAALTGEGAINLAGQTDVPTLAGVLKQCDLLISNDTGTMHLAQAVGTRCLVITLGSALSDETGPYGRGNVIVEPQMDCFPCSFHVQCPHHNCHSRINPEQVAAIAKAMLAGSPLAELSPALFDGIHLWETAFDERGLWIKRPLTRHRPRVDSVVREVLRFMLPLHLDGGTIDPAACSKMVAWQSAALFGTPDARNLHALIGAPLEELGRFVQSLDEIIATLGKMRNLASDPSKHADRLAELAPKVERGIEELTRKHISNSLLRSLLLLFRFERENTLDADLTIQLSDLDKLYRTYRELFVLLGRVIETLPEAWTEAAQEMVEHRIKRSAKAPGVVTPPLIVRPKIDSANGNGSVKHADARLERLRRPRMRGERLTVILPVSGYYLQEEISQALKGLGHRVIPLPFENRTDVVEKLLMASLEADMLITVNHLGFDQDGELAELLHGIHLPIVSWYVDRPGFILLDHHLPPSDLDFIYTWEKSTIPELQGYGFPRVEYLPLAVDPERFTANGPRRGEGDIRWVANSMVHPSAEWREKAKVGNFPKAIFERAVSLQLAARIEPLEAVRSAARMEGYSIESWTRGELLHYASAVALTATRDLRKNLAENLAQQSPHLYGDDGWAELAPGLSLHPPVDYYTELASVYRGAVHLNATSFQMPTAVNQRLFDVPLSAGILITDDQEATYELFDPEELIVYQDPEQACDIVSHTLQNPEPARKRMERAAERIQLQHTYSHRLERIVDRVRRAHLTIVPVEEGGER